MTRTQLQLPDRLYGRAKSYADMCEISMAELFRNAIDMYVSVHWVAEPSATAGTAWAPPVCRKTGLKVDPFADENWRDGLYAERLSEKLG